MPAVACLPIMEDSDRASDTTDSRVESRSAEIRERDRSASSDETESAAERHKPTSSHTAKATRISQLDPYYEKSTKGVSTLRKETWNEPELTGYAKLPSYMWEHLPVEDSECCQDVVQKQAVVYPLSCLLDPKFEAPTNGYLASTQRKFRRRPKESDDTSSEEEEEERFIEPLRQKYLLPSQQPWPALSQFASSGRGSKMSTSSRLDTSGRGSQTSASSLQKLPSITPALSKEGSRAASKNSNRTPARRQSDSAAKRGSPESNKYQGMLPGVGGGSLTTSPSPTAGAAAEAAAGVHALSPSTSSTTTTNHVVTSSTSVQSARSTSQVESATTGEEVPIDLDAITDAMDELQEDPQDIFRAEGLLKCENYFEQLCETGKLVQHPRTKQLVRPDDVKKEVEERRQHFVKRCLRVPVRSSQWTDGPIKPADKMHQAQDGDLSTEQKYMYDRLAQMKYNEWYAQKSKIIAQARQPFKKKTKKTFKERVEEALYVDVPVGIVPPQWMLRELRIKHGKILRDLDIERTEKQRKKREARYNYSRELINRLAQPVRPLEPVRCCHHILYNRDEVNFLFTEERESDVRVRQSWADSLKQDEEPPPSNVSDRKSTTPAGQTQPDSSHSGTNSQTQRRGTKSQTQSVSSHRGTKLQTQSMSSRRGTKSQTQSKSSCKGTKSAIS